MAFANPTTPNLADFNLFLTDQVGISSTVLPSTSPYPGYALDQAIDLVPCLPPAGILYTLAAYNGATHILFAITPDQEGQTFFATMRSAAGYGLVLPSTGLVVTTFDQGTGATLAQPKWADGLTIDQLDFFKSPYGRYYLAYLQKSGPTIVGLT